MSKLFIEKSKAAGTHLIASLIIAAVCMAVVFLIWYPGLLAYATGVTSIFLLLLVVDVCLGPLLTFAVFNPAKKELRRDLIIIVALQISALLYGLNTVWVARPAFVVFAVDRFEVVYANDLDKTAFDKVSNAEFKATPLWGPKWVAAKPPTEIDEINSIMFSSIDGGDDLAQMPRYYRPYSSMADHIVDRAVHTSSLIEINPSPPDAKTLAEQVNDEFNEGYGFLPLQASHADLAVIIDLNSADVVKLVKLNPWQY